MLRRATILSGLAERAAEDAELHLVLVDSAGITTLNEVHLGHEGTTDVISFDLSEEILVPGEPQVAGEIYVCVDVAVQMGEELGTGTAYELVLYCVHGMLHLAGLDDHEDADRERMRAAEARIMAELREIGDLQGIL
jgi:probable rRNA maturation factor